jgi:C-terminal processing protease CtpA/Prc
MATVVGSRTMGAGGNVVNHQQAPNSHVDIRQTESLLLRKDGTYLENNGVEADVKVAVNETAKTKYKEVRDAALKALLPQPPAAVLAGHGDGHADAPGVAPVVLHN